MAPIAKAGESRAVVEGGQQIDSQSLSKKLCLVCEQQFTGPVGTVCPSDGSTLVPVNKDADDLIGHVLAERYLIKSIIGKGGMGLVYLATHTMMDRPVAIKMLHQELLNDPVSKARFQQEAQAASCLNHPHIITMHDFGITPKGQPFLCMEYLQGTPLLNRLRVERSLSPERVVNLFSQVCEALHHAHNQGIVHRDIKPSNIILINTEKEPDFVKVVDFGLAKLMPWSGKESQHLTKTGEVFGSPIYMSPEQCMGKTLDPRSDIYSVGITMYEALTGKPPFRGKNSIDTAHQHMQGIAMTFKEARPEVAIPEALEVVVFKALEKEPSKRFSTMAEMKEAMQRAIAGDAPSEMEVPESLISSRAGIRAISATVKVATAPESMQKSRALRSTSSQPEPAKKNVAAIASGIIALFAFAGGGGYWWWSQNSQTTAVVPQKAAGIVYYLEDSEKNKVVHLKTKDGLVKLFFDRPLNELGNKPEAIGKAITVDHVAIDQSGGRGIVQATVAEGEPDAHAVMNTARSFFVSLATTKPDDVLKNYEIVSLVDPNNEALLKQFAGKMNPIWRNTGEWYFSSVDNGGHIDSSKPGPPPHVFKIAEFVPDKSASILLNNAYLTTIPDVKSWQMDLKCVKETWKIVDIKPLKDMQLWDSH